MTTTEPFSTLPPPPPPPRAAAPRKLRRSTSDRIGAGVAGGLGEYFEVDPVLFRVLFAVAAFFGGAGVLAYLLAWVAIPDAGTASAPIDRFVATLRRRRVPLWIVAVVLGLALWGIAFSWWVPNRSVPVFILVIVLVAILVSRGSRRYDRAVPPSPAFTDVPAAAGMQAAPSAAASTAPPSTAAATQTDDMQTQPLWTEAPAPPLQSSVAAWIEQSRQAARERRRRTAPLRIATFGVLLLVLAILAAIDAGHGIAIPVYLWVTLGIVLLGLVAGAIARRTPWSAVPLLVPAVVGLIAFGSTGASLHDGMGQRNWTPTTETALADHYRLAFGKGVLDLRALTSIGATHTIDVRLAAGQVRVLLPATMNATVNTSVRFGEVDVRGLPSGHPSEYDSHGFGISRTVLPPTNATGDPVTINVSLADGNVSVEYPS